MLDKKVLLELQEYVESHSNVVFSPICNYVGGTLSESIHHNELEDFIKNTRQPTFRQVLFSFIDKKGASDSDIYKRAGIDRRHFSKTRSNPDYRPGKNSVIALTMALELNKKEGDKLLSAAGYSLSESDTFDLVIQFCLAKKIYNIHDVNQALDYFSLKPLIGVLE
ncbi:MAG: hypothetical protein Q7J85_10025 [Bacillota bacterium]|nr:hypothetical protein [Bacillota bacterium]